MSADLLALLDQLDEAGPEYPTPWRQDSGWGENILAAGGDEVGGTAFPSLAALIVAAVNALPELLRLARERYALEAAVLALADELDREGEVRLAHTGMWGPAADRHLVADRLRATMAAALTPEPVQP